MAKEKLYRPTQPCPECGSTMSRYSRTYGGGHERWNCQNPDCKHVFIVNARDVKPPTRVR